MYQDGGDECWTNKRPRKIPSKGKFDHKEDELLRSLVAAHGEDWEEVAKSMPNRNARQVRDRYVNYLSPLINQAPFTKDEDVLLMEKYQEFGAKWVKIAKCFGNRRDAALKNRYQLLERRLRKGKPIKYETVDAKPEPVLKEMVLKQSNTDNSSEQTQQPNENVMQYWKELMMFPFSDQGSIDVELFSIF